MNFEYLTKKAVMLLKRKRNNLWMWNLLLVSVSSLLFILVVSGLFVLFFTLSSLKNSSVLPIHNESAVETVQVNKIKEKRTAKIDNKRDCFKQSLENNAVPGDEINSAIEKTGDLPGDSSGDSQRIADVKKKQESDSVEPGRSHTGIDNKEESKLAHTGGTKAKTVSERKKTGILPEHAASTLISEYPSSNKGQAQGGLTEDKIQVATKNGLNILDQKSEAAMAGVLESSAAGKTEDAINEGTASGEENSDIKGILNPTPWSIEFTGVVEASAGSRLYAYTPRGTVCGIAEVKEDGSYGLLHVYIDDESTEIDEGLRYGDKITFQANGREVYPLGHDDIIYDGCWGTIRPIDLGG